MTAEIQAESDVDIVYSTLTAPGRGAIGVIVLEGAGAELVLMSHSSTLSGKKVDRLPAPNNHAYLLWKSDAGSEDIVLVCLEKERFEINCHGGTIPIQAICKSLDSAGCKCVSSLKWLAKNQPIQLSIDTSSALLRATTKKTATVILDQGRNLLPEMFRDLIDSILAGKVTEAIDCIEGLLNRSKLGMRLCDPFRIVVAGAPNVGKSSLINAIVGFERTIVFGESGTTRDAVAVGTSIFGWPIQLFDTAGIRQTENSIEIAGIQRAQEFIKTADFVIRLFDISQHRADQSIELDELDPGKCITVWNKSDLVAQNSIGENELAISATNRVGIDELLEILANRLGITDFDANLPTLFSQNQVEAIEKVRIYLQAGKHKDAIARIVESFGIDLRRRTDK